MLVLQEARCPACHCIWDLPEKEFVAVGEVLRCRYGCAPFTADADTVMCCLEDADGMLQMPLRRF